MDKELFLKQLNELLNKDYPIVSNLSNASSFLCHSLSNINWLGFYFLKDGDLYLGPFQGKPACTILKKGRGVCQKAIELKETLYVKDVTKFEGHIACDSASKSELVIPVKKGEDILGVLDIDSPLTDRFNNEEIELLNQAVTLINNIL